MASSTILARLGDRRRRGWIVLVLLLAAGLVVYFPALRSRFILDDYLHAAMVDGTYPAQRGPLDLYDFVNDADRAMMSERGMLPWWSHPKLKIRFFRPLPSALRWAEHRVVGRAPALLHVHSLLWWIAAVLAVRRLYRRYLPSRPALFATVIFALAPCHALPIAWLANREALISLTFGALALGSYARFREGEGVRHAFFASLLYAFAVSGGEYALCFAGYVIAYELRAHHDSLRSRFTGFLPFAVPALAYVFVRARLGYGAEGSGFYADPLRAPLTFLRLAPRRLVILLAEEWLTFDGEVIRASTPWWALGLLVVGCLALFVAPLRRAYANADEGARHAAGWLLLGSVVALLPVLAVVPSPRLLGAGVLGLAPSIALLFEHAWFPAVPPARRGLDELTGWAALALGFAHLVHGPGTAWRIGRSYHLSSVDYEKWAVELRERLDPDIAKAEVICLRGWDSAFFMPFALDPRGVSPAHWRALSSTGHVLAMRRGDRTVDLIAPKGAAVVHLSAHHLFRDATAPMTAGDVFHAPGFKATVLEATADGPRVVRFELDQPLEAAADAWVTETAKGFPEAKLPKPGFGQPFDP